MPKWFGQSKKLRFVSGRENGASFDEQHDRGGSETLCSRGKASKPQTEEEHGTGGIGEALWPVSGHAVKAGARKAVSNAAHSAADCHGIRSRAGLLLHR